MTIKAICGIFGDDTMKCNYKQLQADIVQLKADNDALRKDIDFIKADNDRLRASQTTPQ